MSRYDYDLIVIGGGIAGFVASSMANGLGKKVAIIEKDRLGGNCALRACIPKKALVEASSIAHRVKKLKDFGLTVETPIRLNTDGVMPYVRSIVEKVYQTDLPESFESIGIKIIKGEAEFLDRHSIRIGEETISAKSFIIASGSRALVPPIEGLDKVPYLTNENVFNIDKLPKSIIVLGGGPAGMEMATAFCHLGLKTTVVEMVDSILFREDRELVDRLTAILQKDGLGILTGYKAVKFSKEKSGINLTIQDKKGGIKNINAEAVLIALGRKADIEGLALEKAGVKYTPKGITTNSKMQTSAGNIYACGDVVGPYQFAAMAEYQAIIAAFNALLPLKRSASYDNTVWVTFTEPQLARCGLSEEEARKRYGNSIKVYRYEYSKARRAIVDQACEGIAKVVCNASGKVLGAHILGLHAEDLIHEIQLLKSLKEPLSKIHSIIHAYPTYSEAIIKRLGDISYTDSLASNPLFKLALSIMPGYNNNLKSIKDKL